MTRDIRILDLGSPCLTRKKGREAAELLKPQVDAQTTILDLNGVEMLSFSFLDGLISELTAEVNAARLVFRADDPDVIDKLARIAAIRNICVFNQDTRHPARPLVPTPLQKSEALFTATKVAE